jgi:murein DD-endopeptidase MepM/ murein hydrolase activator NlpD
VFAIALATFPGCLLAGRVPETTLETPAPTAPTDPIEAESGLPEGVFHVVRDGQTLWRIALGYGVPLESIVASNGIDDPAALEVGAALFVPGARAILDIAPFPAPPPVPPSMDPRPRTGGVDGGPEWTWPLVGDVLSRFGDDRRSHRHRGLDIRGRRGEGIVAARAGRVVFAGRGGGGYGLTVVIEHGDGLQSLYAHNEALLVEVGEHVALGQAIARCGRTGNATTEHVHFEIRRHDVHLDPMSLLGETGEAR